MIRLMQQCDSTLLHLELDLRFNEWICLNSHISRLRISPQSHWVKTKVKAIFIAWALDVLSHLFQDMVQSKEVLASNPIQGSADSAAINSVAFSRKDKILVCLPIGLQIATIAIELKARRHGIGSHSYLKLEVCLAEETTASCISWSLRIASGTLCSESACTKTICLVPLEDKHTERKISQRKSKKGRKEIRIMTRKTRVEQKRKAKKENGGKRSRKKREKDKLQSCIDRAQSCESQFRTAWFQIRNLVLDLSINTKLDNTHESYMRRNDNVIFKRDACLLL